MSKKLSHIAIGWLKRWGLLPVSIAEVKMAEARANICKGCPESKESKVLELLNGEGVHVKVLQCTKCTCPVYQKTIVVDEKCPLGKW